MIYINKLTGEKFRLYHISFGWACIIPYNKPIHDKIMVSIGDFYEDYKPLKNGRKKVCVNPVK